MAILWPLSLPARPLVDGNLEGLADNLAAFETETGPAKQRARSTSGPRPLSYNFALSAAQVETFKDFYNVDLQGGALPFEFISPRDGAILTVRHIAGRAPAWRNLQADRWQLGVEWQIMP